MKQHSLRQKVVTIGHLPPELLQMVLLSIDSAQALYSLIRAYPRAYHMFRAHRHKILRAVLQNATYPETLRDLLFTDAIKAPLLDPLFPFVGLMGINYSISPQGRQLKRAIRPWIQRYFMGEPPEYPIDTPGVVRLLQILTVVNRFADLYARHAANLLVGPRPPTISATPQAFPTGYPPLTHAEKRRFHRAFLRYELYSRLFPRDPVPPDPPDPPRPGQRPCRMSVFTAHEQYRLFIRRLDTWKVEELSCVHNFLFSLVREWMAEMDDQVVHAVRSAPGAFSIRDGDTGNDLQHLCHDGEPNDMVCYKDNSTNSDTSEKSTSVNTVAVSLIIRSDSSESLFHHVDRDNRPRHHSKLTSYGLAFIQRLHDAGPDARREMMRREGICGRDFLPEALHFDPDPPGIMPPYVTTSTSPSRSRTAARSWPSSWRSWLIADRSYRQIYDYNEAVAYNPSRERAYIFWDEERLKDPVVARGLHVAAHLSAEEVSERTSLGPTVEERLWDIRLPRKERKRIREMFGFYEEGGSDTFYEEGDDEPELPGL